MATTSQGFNGGVMLTHAHLRVSQPNENLHGPWCPPSFGRERLRVSGSPVSAGKHKARRDLENVTMTKGGPELTHPERCLFSCSWSLPKQSYCFSLNLKDREN